VVCGYTGPAISKAVIATFGNPFEIGRDKYPKKALRVLGFLADPFFWFGCEILQKTGT